VSPITGALSHEHSQSTEHSPRARTPCTFCNASTATEHPMQSDTHDTPLFVQLTHMTRHCPCVSKSKGLRDIHEIWHELYTSDRQLQSPTCFSFLQPLKTTWRPREVLRCGSDKMCISFRIAICCVTPFGLVILCRLYTVVGRAGENVIKLQCGVWCGNGA
jgi:hypothetical protein